MTADTLTRLTLPEASVACIQAYERVFGKPPSRSLLVFLLAQSALETGRWKAMHCWNAGNIRGRGPGGAWTSIEGASEVVGGREVWFRGGVWRDKLGAVVTDLTGLSHDNAFAAYKDPVDGFEGLIRFLCVASHPPKPNRYAPAVEAAERGDVAAYCHLLKHPPSGQPGYYTADEELYRRGVQAQVVWVEEQLFPEEAA